jgi:hypothetical protein
MQSLFDLFITYYALSLFFFVSAFFLSSSKWDTSLINSTAALLLMFLPFIALINVIVLIFR